MKNTKKNKNRQLWSFLQVCDSYGLDLQSSEGVRIRDEVYSMISKATDAFVLAHSLAKKFRLPLNEVQAALT